MRVSHGVLPVFDDPNLVSAAGLVPVVGLAERCELEKLVDDTLTLAGVGSANAAVKVSALVAGMVAGADSIEDMGLLRHGGMGRVFTGIRAPSTLGTFLRSFTFGHVRQLDAVAARFLVNLAGHTPLLPGAEQVTLVDVDDTVKQTYGYAKQGVGRGYTGVNGLNALIGVLSTPTAAPVIAATRLRKGSTNSARGAARLVGDTLATAKKVGAGAAPGGLILVRMDSAFYNADVVAAVRRGGAKFSITARLDKAVIAAIAAIEEEAWTTIRYPNAIWEEAEQRWISDAEVAEIGHTAFTSRKTKQVTGRLPVRRVRRLNPAGAGKHSEQGELFAAYRYHAVFTDSDLALVQAESLHRGHPVVEQVIADLKAGPLAHLPSGVFQANAAWLLLAAIAFDLTRAAGCLASVFHAHARASTIRAHLVHIPGRLASSARRLTVHLPRKWPWQQPWQQLFDAANAPPAPKAA